MRLNDNADGEGDVMRLTVLGKYGPFPKEGGATSGYLLEAGEKKIVLDLGSGVFSRLEKIIPPENVDAIVITHFHFDHASDAPIYAYYLQQLENRNLFDKKIKLFCPKSESPLCKAVCAFKYFDVHFVEEKKYSIGELELSFYLVRHPELCYGVKITNDEGVFAYTGDTNDCPSVEKLFRRSDLVLADGGLLERDRKENSPHLSIEKCIEYGKTTNVKTIITHINPLYSEDEILKRTGNDERWKIAQEGKSYDF